MSDGFREWRKKGVSQTIAVRRAALEKLTRERCRQAKVAIEGHIDSFLSKNTRIAYRHDLKKFLQYLDRPRAAEDYSLLLEALVTVDRSQAAFYRDDLLKHGLAPSTVARKITVIYGVYEVLRKEGLIDLNPFASVRRPRVPAIGHTPAFSEEEMRKMLYAPDDSPMGRRDRCLLLLLFYCGLRRSEIVKVRVEDFIQHSGHTLLRIDGKGQAGRTHVVKVPDHVWKEICCFIGECRAGYLFRSCSSNPSYFTDDPIGPQRVYYIIKAYCRKVGLDPRNFTVHSTRATFVTLALEKGASLRAVQLAARHSDPATTLLYDRNRMNWADNAVDYLPTFDKPPGSRKKRKRKWLSEQ